MNGPTSTPARLIHAAVSSRSLRLAWGMLVARVELAQTVR